MKFSGKLGFWCGDEETKPGIFKPKIIERPYFGDVLKDKRTFQTSGNQNSNLVISNQISVISDVHLQNNWTSVKYVVWRGVKWSVKYIDVDYPRISLTLGDVYNGT